MASVQIELTQGKFATIDEGDVELVSRYKWHAAYRGHTWYAATSAERRKGKSIYLHRLIVGAEENEVVDHVDHDGLNCQRLNLRICTNAQNRKNTQKTRGNSIYKGVALCKTNKTRIWEAYIWDSNKKRGLGCYETEAEAARAYNAAALIHHGRFACLNKIEGLTYAESIDPPVRNRKRGRRSLRPKDIIRSVG